MWQPKKKRSGPKVEPEKIKELVPELADFAEFVEGFNNESDRGTVLVCAAYLEYLLGELLEAHFKDGKTSEALLKGGNAPLGTFSARISTCWALGIISDEERDDCDIIRKVRNEFAHSHKTSFADDKPKGLCKNLHNSAKKTPSRPTEARAQFSTAAIKLLIDLLGRTSPIYKSISTEIIE